MGLFGLFGTKQQAKPVSKKNDARQAADSTKKSAEKRTDTTAGSPEKKRVKTNLSAENIRHFLPIRLLPARVMSYIASQGDLTAHAAGEEIPRTGPGYDHSTVYLLKGEVEFHNEGGPTRRVISTDAKATFPLVFDPSGKQRVIAKTKSLLIHFPAELIKGAEKMSPDGKTYGVDEVDDAMQPAIFMELVDDAKAGNLELPSPPDLGVRIGRAIDKPEASSADVARIIQLDPALSARLIQVANSPLYSGLGKITNCSTAVTRLGLATTRNLVISFLLKNLFRNKSRILQEAMDEVWKTSTRVAAISSVLAKVTPRLEPGRAMLAGLIHEIGAIAVINDAKRHAELMEDADALRMAVKKLSPEIGAIILEQWNFGDDLVDVVVNASDWMRDESPNPTYTDLVLVAQLHAKVGSRERKNLPRLDLVPAFHKLALGRLSPKLSVAVLDQSTKEIKEVENLLG
jgi:HD-like signal output (HDOD) protein